MKQVSEERDAVIEVATKARAATRALANASRQVKDDALHAMADSRSEGWAIIVEANSKDVAAARDAGTSEAIVDRLTLNTERIKAVADALRDVADLSDPIGEVVRGYRVPNGLEITQVRVPLGVVAMIYEARPNVTVDAAGLALKSGNCVILRGSSSAHHTNVELVRVMRAALEGTKIPADAIQLAPGTSHEAAKHLMTARGLVDVIIPRGGAGLINAVVTESTVPVIETGVGNCHVYVDASADVAMAVRIVMNSKTQRVSVCNAAETLLVDRAIADTFLPIIFNEFKDAGVTVHGDQAIGEVASNLGVNFALATETDWADEYYSLDIAVAVVDGVEGAISHIRRWSTGHTEAIVATSAPVIREFVQGMDSAAVMVNASTRFTDGGEFGFGAEIGISTQKLHARGPMGLTELTTTSYIVVGDGQIRE